MAALMVVEKDKLRNLYIEKKLSTRKCAEILKCDQKTIMNKMGKYNIPTRTRSESRKGIISHKKGRIYEEIYGVKRAKEIKEKMSESKRGHISSQKNKTYEEIHGTKRAKKIREKISRATKGQRNSPTTEFPKGYTPWNKGKKLPPLTKEHIKNCLRRRIPSSLEKKFQKIIDKYNLPYKYVGNGKFFIERYNPDFINTNSEKVAVEVYARFYKRLDRRNIEKWKEQRTKVFKKYGWNIVFFDETEVNEQYILNTLKEV